jgi:malonate-semialdehyde dehydrogenase (acetylating)/methylmalonate-semialdehyde dehydrogenase
VGIYHLRLDEFIAHAQQKAKEEDYALSILRSHTDRRVALKCDRGGTYRKRSLEERQRQTGTRLVDCPFEIVGKKEDGTLR